ncbi:MAG TPA: multidrug transporter AcrB [Rhodospirillaceae bacterium]|nr:MAG: multidrug transporter AcrB [Alphaproteobacteria bacterium GWF2_58_20]HAU29417.1 multidrug transporter AcrB [Rhodospirillaceae bacterium]
MKLGISGTITKNFISAKLTPLLLLAALLIGTMALIALPREEEPQISVPMVDIFVSANGLNAEDAMELVTKPLEQIVSGIDGVEHTYSQTSDDSALVTARFFTGTNSDDAILRVHSKIRANYDRMPMGIPEPLIVGRGINDVATLVLTLSPKPSEAARWNDTLLYKLAGEIQSELVKTRDVGLTTLVGGRPEAIRIEPDPERMQLYGISLNQLIEKIENTNRSSHIGALRDGGLSVPVSVGDTLKGPEDIALLLMGSRDGRPVYVSDVAKIVSGASLSEKRVFELIPQKDGSLSKTPAVSISFSKRAGANAVTLSEDLLARLKTLKGVLIPADIDVTVTRDYGKTAKDKANHLLTDLLSATITIVILMTIAVSWREGAVLFIVVPTTILLTMFSSWILGYTINRVSLFALIFSIGILVDDAIVVVENIDRHWAMRDGRSRTQAAWEAVAEVGNPTLLATIMIVAALLPMMFVSGMMGPYMSPIPANASMAMMFSFLVAVIITPWLMIRLHKDRGEYAYEEAEGSGGKLGALYLRMAIPILKTRRRAMGFLIGSGVATLLAILLVPMGAVSVKLLPYDNKSEMEVLIDLPEGAPLEATERALTDAAHAMASIPELSSMELYAGTAAPFNFNGLVRHYYLRQRPELGELQVNLLPKEERKRASHDIALDIRKRLSGLELPEGSAIRVAEVPPGPPVLATLLAEIYGPDDPTRRAVAEKVKQAFASVPFIVDMDDSWGTPTTRLRFTLKQDSLEFHGVEQQAVIDTLGALVGGVSVGYSHRGHGRDPIAISVRMPKNEQALTERLLATPVPGTKGNVDLGDLVNVRKEKTSPAIFRRNGRNTDMVMAELAGEKEAPVYGMMAVEKAIKNMDFGNLPKPVIRYHGQPLDETVPTLLWDGEWEVTYVTFRDLGLAFGVALMAIYLMLVGQFGSFKLPLVIMTPIPLTLIGVLTGHALLDVQFTATSMIGFIALAGIIVRNSILLVDFIRQRQNLGMPLHTVLMEAGAIRFKPIFLTVVTSMIGAAFMLKDPIFQGLAVSLLFGLAAATILTVLAIPAVYMVMRGERK